MYVKGWAYRQRPILSKEKEDMIDRDREFYVVTEQQRSLQTSSPFIRRSYRSSFCASGVTFSMQESVVYSSHTTSGRT
jgi:hypothetical protein